MLQNTEARNGEHDQQQFYPGMSVSEGIIYIYHLPIIMGLLRTGG